MTPKKIEDGSLTYFFRPWVTYFLIAINVAVFLVTLPMSISQQSMLSCFEQNYPECLQRVDEGQFDTCIFDKISGKHEELSREEIDWCLYDIKDECAGRNNPAYKECLKRDNLMAATLGVHSDAFFHPKEWYTFITSEFTHANFSHLFSNMIMLLLIGPYVESRLRRKYFLALYLGSGILGSIVFALFSPGYSTLLVGASGAISGLLGASLFLDFTAGRIPEDQRVLIWGMRPYRLSAAYLAFFIFQQIFLGIFEGGPIAYAGHLGSFLGGLIMMSFFFALRSEQSVLRTVE